MARQTLRIIGGILANYLTMRIMATHATEPPVHSVEALAVGQPVGLKTNICFAPKLNVLGHGLPCPMTLAAKMGNILC